MLCVVISKPADGWYSQGFQLKLLPMNLAYRSEGKNNIPMVFALKLERQRHSCYYVKVCFPNSLAVIILYKSRIKLATILTWLFVCRQQIIFGHLWFENVCLIAFRRPNPLTVLNLLESKSVFIFIRAKYRLTNACQISSLYIIFN